MNDMTDFNSWKNDWLAAFKAAGHIPIMDDGRIDVFVVEGGYHNGPGCSKCGWSCCYHCVDAADIPQCSKVTTEADKNDAFNFLTLAETIGVDIKS